MSDERRDAPSPANKKAGLVQVAKAVFWSFLGIRKSEDRDRDAGTITPLQVIVAGVIGAGVLVFSVIMIVRWVTH